MKFPLSTNRVLSNSIWLFIGKVVSALLNLYITALIANTLGEDGFGQFSFVLAYMSIALVISTFGMDIYVIRLVALDNEVSYFSETSGALLVQLILAGLLVIITIIGSYFFEYLSKYIDVLKLYLFIFIPSSFGTIFNGVLKGREMMGYYVICTLVDLCIQLAAIWLLLSESSSIDSLILILLVAKSIAVVLAGVFVHMTTTSVSAFNFPSLDHLKTIIITGSYISLGIIFTTIFHRLGVLTVSWLSTDVNVGIFNAANKIVDGFKILPAVFYGALFPSMVKREPFFLSQKIGIFFLFFCMLILTAMGFLFSSAIIDFIFEGFDSSKPLLRVLILSIIPFVWRQYYSLQFFAKGQERKVVFVSLVSNIIAIIAYYGALQNFGLIGLCWAINLVLLIEALIYILIKNIYKISFS